MWNDKKNNRRCNLIDREIDNTITSFEKVELEYLQQEMLSWRNKVAPLPLEEVRIVYDNMKSKI